VIFGNNGRFYTLGADKLPGGRGHGEPLRLMLDIGNDSDLIDIFVHDPARKLLVASSDGRGFVVPEAEVVAQTRNGKQVLNLSDGALASVVTPVVGDHVAVVGQNRRLLIFSMLEMPEMTRGKGVILQRFGDGGLSDVKCFSKADGLSWSLGERTRVLTEHLEWLGRRAGTGRMVPVGFPRSNKFSG